MSSDWIIFLELIGGLCSIIGLGYLYLFLRVKLRPKPRVGDIYVYSFNGEVIEDWEYESKTVYIITRVGKKKAIAKSYTTLNDLKLNVAHWKEKEINYVDLWSHYKKITSEFKTKLEIFNNELDNILK